MSEKTQNSDNICTPLYSEIITGSVITQNSDKYLLILNMLVLLRVYVRVSKGACSRKIATESAYRDNPDLSKHDVITQNSDNICFSC